ncbi:hypothetical protein Pmani_027670 [Petrolisthes manimaculis]|nr:hypothetical protein Pmani_027670 [Petrolisthes manimaculis]
MIQCMQPPPNPSAHSQSTTSILSISPTYTRSHATLPSHTDTQPPLPCMLLYQYPLRKPQIITSTFTTDAQPPSTHPHHPAPTCTQPLCH